MRRFRLLAPMTILLLLAGCAGAGGSKAETLAFAIQEEMAGATACTAEVSLTADYGERVYDYVLDLAAEGEETVLTLRAPETVAGITARLTEKDHVLEYDGLSLETGDLDGRGLTPISAVPVLLETARTGCFAACSLEEEGKRLRVDYQEAEGASGVETVLWFDTDTHALTAGEIRVEGWRSLRCEFADFTLAGGTQSDGSFTDENLGGDQPGRAGT